MDDILQLAVIRGKRVLVKTTLSDNILLPGYYLADGTGSAIHILAPDGEKILYWVERTF
jgi:hypothetical protein